MNEPRHPTVNEVVSSLQEVFAPGGLSVLPVFVDDSPWEPTIVEPIRIQGRIDLAATLDEALPYFGTVCVLAVGSNGGRQTCDGLVLIGREIAFIPIAVSPGWLRGDQ